MANKEYTLDVSKFHLEALFALLLILLLFLFSVDWQEMFTVWNGIRAGVFVFAAYKVSVLMMKHQSIASAIETVVNVCDGKKVISDHLSALAKTIESQELYKHERLANMHKNGADSDHIRIERDMRESETRKHRQAAENLIAAADTLWIINLGSVTAYFRKTAPAAS